MNEKPQEIAIRCSATMALDKGLGIDAPVASDEEIGRLKLNLLREDLSLPAAVLYQDKLLNNLNWMRQFAAAYGVKLAPHGKTTMAPKLFRMQLEAGAWAITLATAQQTAVACAHGVRRVLMANQLVGRQNMSLISHLLQDPEFEFYCLVDSADLIDQLGAFFAKRGQRLRVLLELGVDGGRAGVRNEEQLNAALQAFARCQDAVALCGIELYEGVLSEEASIRAFLSRAVDVMRRLLEQRRLTQAPALLSGAGSAWYDVVAEVFTAARFPAPVEIVLRPGCYLTHDVGAYRAAHARICESNAVARKIPSCLQPALQVWAYVQSRPEAEKAIIAMGKRDAAFDSGLPVPALHMRPGEPAPRLAPALWTLTKMMDQHAYMKVAPGDDLRVGDMIGFDIAHPCLTFDKWRALPLLNRDYQVINIVRTFF